MNGEKNGREDARTGLVDTILALDIKPLDLDKVTCLRDIENFCTQVENTVSKDKNCSQDALFNMQFNWTTINRSEPNLCEDDYGIPIKMEEITGIMNQKRSQVQDNSSKCKYLEWLTKGKYKTVAKTWVKNDKLSLAEVGLTVEDSDFFRSGRGDYSYAEIWRKTAQIVRRLLGTYLVNNDIMERWLTGGWFRNWPDFRAKLLDQCDFQEKVQDDRRLSVMHKTLKSILLSPGNYKRNCQKLETAIQPFMIQKPLEQVTGKEYGAIGNDYQGQAETFEIGYKEVIGPGVRSMISMLACLNLPTKDVVKCEDKFLEENESLGPISMMKHRYKWHRIVGKMHPKAAPTKLVAQVGVEDEDSWKDQVEEVLAIGQRRFPSARFENKDRFKSTNRFLSQPAVRNSNGAIANMEDVCRHCLRERPKVRLHTSSSCTVGRRTDNRSRQQANAAQSRPHRQSGRAGGPHKSFNHGGKRFNFVKRGMKNDRQYVVEVTTEDEDEIDEVASNDSFETLQGDDNVEESVNRIGEIFTNDITALDF